MKVEPSCLGLVVLWGEWDACRGSLLHEGTVRDGGPSANQEAGPCQALALPCPHLGLLASRTVRNTFLCRSTLSLCYYVNSSWYEDLDLPHLLFSGIYDLSQMRGVEESDPRWFSCMLFPGRQWQRSSLLRVFSTPVIRDLGVGQVGLRLTCPSVHSGMCQCWLDFEKE